MSDGLSAVEVAAGRIGNLLKAAGRWEWGVPADAPRRARRLRKDGRVEVPCSVCSGRTRSRLGVCAGCRQDAKVELPYREFVGTNGRGMYPKGDQLERLRSALLRGMSIHAAADAVGCTRWKARKLKAILTWERLMVGHGEIQCPCGMESGHQGWCTHRYMNSEARQLAMASLHAKQRGE